MSRQVIPKRGSRAARMGRGLVGTTYVYLSVDVLNTTVY